MSFLILIKGDTMTTAINTKYEIHSEAHPKYCNICCVETSFDEEDNCEVCGNHYGEETSEKDEEIQNLASENRNMANALSSLGFSLEEITAIAYGSLIPKQSDNVISDDDIRRFVADSMFSDDKDGLEIYNEYMENPEDLDLNLWEPFEDYPTDWIKNHLEKDFNSLKSFVSKRNQSR